MKCNPDRVEQFARHQTDTLRTDTRGALAAASPTGLDVQPSQDRPIRVVLNKIPIPCFSC